MGFLAFFPPIVLRRSLRITRSVSIMQYQGYARRWRHPIGSHWSIENTWRHASSQRTGLECIRSDRRLFVLCYYLTAPDLKPHINQWPSGSLVPSGVADSRAPTNQALDWLKNRREQLACPFNFVQSKCGNKQVGRLNLISFPFHSKQERH